MVTLMMKTCDDVLYNHFIEWILILMGTNYLKGENERFSKGLVRDLYSFRELKSTIRKHERCETVL